MSHSLDTGANMPSTALSSESNAVCCSGSCSKPLMYEPGGMRCYVGSCCYHETCTELGRAQYATLLNNDSMLFNCLLCRSRRSTRLVDKCKFKWDWNDKMNQLSDKESNLNCFCGSCPQSDLTSLPDLCLPVNTTVRSECFRLMPHGSPTFTNARCCQDEEYHLGDTSVLSTRIAFGARHLCEKIEGATLYEEKHHKEKTKTAASALVLCLNIDIDPPDIPKIPPYSRVEAWFDPTDANSLRALETIGKNLQAQYERWQPRARFKQCLDPTLDDVKNLCLNLRRNFKNDRILFHYNGHGVPRPTENGEIWVFNTKFTKYIPLSLYDLQRWLGAPSVYVFDCQNAGRVIRMYEHFCHRRKREAAAATQRQHNEVTEAHVLAGSTDLSRTDAHRTGTRQETDSVPLQAQGGSAVPSQVNPNPLVSMENTIMLAACGETEDLPQSAVLPADMFTACLTTPIRMALRWHSLRYQDKFPGCFDEALLDRIPGAHSNRMSLLGEINWIFTAVTDTIAWCSFSIDVFQKLFRQDLLVAGLFRNFLLAERIMKMCGCTPVSAPALPPTFRHPVWSAWDHALDRLVHYLPRVLKLLEGSPHQELKLPILVNNTHSCQPPHSTSGGIPQQPIAANPPLPVSSEQVFDAVHQPNAPTGVANGSGCQKQLTHQSRNAGPPGGIADANISNQSSNQLRSISSRPPSKLNNEHVQPGVIRGHTQVPQVPTRPGLMANTKVDCHPIVAPPGFSRPADNMQQPIVAGLAPSLRPLPCNPSILSSTAHHLIDGRKRTLPTLQENKMDTRRSVAAHPVHYTPKSHSKMGAGTDRRNEIRSCNRDPATDDTIVADGLASNDQTAEPHDANGEFKSPTGEHVERAQMSKPKVSNSQDVAEEEGDDSDEDEDDEDEDTDEELDDSEDVDENAGEGEISVIHRPGDKTAVKGNNISGTTHHNGPYRSGNGKTKDVRSNAISKCAHLPHRFSCPSLTSLHHHSPSTALECPPCAPQAVNGVNQDEVEVKQQPNGTQASNAPNVTCADVQLTMMPVAILQHGNETTETSAVTTTTTGRIELSQPPAVAPFHPSATVNHVVHTTSAALKRQHAAMNKLYAMQATNNQQPPAQTGVPNGHNRHAPQTDHVLPSRVHPVVPCTTRSTTVTSRDIRAPITTQAPSSGPSQPSVQPTVTAPESSTYGGSVIGGNGPASFFTSQMTAFKVWLRTANEKQPPAMQLPILLQILLSQSHRTRAMQLLSEFLDLGPWAVTHCLMVGILPYIVRLFSSNLFEVKPHLVFIWGKIIASAQTEFSRNDSVRDVGYKYFINCLNDSENLSPLTRTITAFALTKMLEKEPHGEPDAFFQEVSLKQNFIPMILSQLYDNPPDQERELYVRMRLWFIFALGKLWRKNDEARWFAARYNVIETLLAYLNDVSPEVRAATVYAFGTLADNQTTDAVKQDHADQINQQICAHLIKLATLEASGLVRCELVAALCGLVRQFESQLCAISYRYIQWLRCDISLYSSPPTRQARYTIASPNTASLRSPAFHEDPSTHRKYFVASPKLKRSALHAVYTFFAAGNNIYAQLWMALVHLSNDPHPKVSSMSGVVMQYILTKVSEKFSTPSVCIPTSAFPYGPTNQKDCPAEVSQEASDTKASPSETGDGISCITSVNSDSVSYGPSDQRVPTYATSDLPSDQNRNFQPQSPSNPTIAASNPVPALDSSPTSQAASNHSTSASPAMCHPMKSGTQLRTHGPNVALTSAFLTHSAQFPGRRHHQVDPLFRKPLLDSITQPAVAHTPAESSSSTNEVHPLDSVQKTQFFAWSCRWFTRPLLSQYGGESPENRADSGHTPSSLNNPISRIPPYFDVAGIPKSRHCSTGSEAELAALCAVAADAAAVSYADRFTRLFEQRTKFREGQAAWLDFLAGGLRSSNRLSECGGLIEDRCKSSDMVSHQPGELRRLAYCCASAIPTIIRFHPHQAHMAVADHGGLALYSSATLERLNYLCTPSEIDPFTLMVLHNGSTPERLRSRITDVQFINCCDERSLVLCAHDNGRIQIWQNYLRDSGQEPEIVTAWTGLTELLPSSNPAGVVVHWSPSSSQLTLGGDARHIRLWDCERESRIRDVSTGADACVTVLTRSADQRLLCAGFGDGAVRVFDLRVPSSCSPSSHHSDCHIFSGHADSGWIHAVAFSPSGRLYAAGSSGGIAAWQLNVGSTQPSGQRSRRSTESSCNTSTLRPGHGVDAGRFERLPCSPRLSASPNSLVHCAALKVDLSPPSTHVLVAGLSGSSEQISIHRLHDGSIVYSFGKQLPKSNKSTLRAPTSVTVHPVKPLIAAGFQDGSLILLDVESKTNTKS